MCYLNVILQTLSSIPVARAALTEGSAGPEKPIHHQLSRTLHALRFQHGGMVDATALFAALRWSTYQQGDCAAALIALIDSLKIEAKSPAAFDVLDRLTTTSIMSTVRRNKDPDNNAIVTYDLECHTIINLRMPDAATPDAPRKAKSKPTLVTFDLTDCIDTILQPEPLTDFKIGPESTPQPASREQTLSKLAPVLFFQLEKTGRSRTPVRFPLRLHLEDDSGPQPYLLTALILHPPITSRQTSETRQRVYGTPVTTLP